MRGTKRPEVCLLVASHADDQQAFIQALRDVAPGSVCYIATDADEAIRILTYGQRFPSYIFLDMNSARVNAREFIEKVRATEELKDVPIVVRSSHPLPEEMEELQQLGVTGILAKEVNQKNIREMLHQYLV